MASGNICALSGIYVAKLQLFKICCGYGLSLGWKLYEVKGGKLNTCLDGDNKMFSI